MNRDIEESWELFMKLCEEFPELYDKYAEKTEQEMKDYKLPFEITEKKTEPTETARGKRAFSDLRFPRAFIHKEKNRIYSFFLTMSAAA